MDDRRGGGGSSAVVFRIRVGAGGSQQAVHTLATLSDERGNIGDCASAICTSQSPQKFIRTMGNFLSGMLALVKTNTKVGQCFCQPC